ncbi:hypothetical protein H6F86_04350 [Phormidium sp. FACHB-592]|nr:hypothetical protein [Phormidium sp. FACHB-592]
MFTDDQLRHTASLQLGSSVNGDRYCQQCQQYNPLPTLPKHLCQKHGKT